MVGYVLIMGLANLALGFALAVLLKRVLPMLAQQPIAIAPPMTPAAPTPPTPTPITAPAPAAPAPQAKPAPAVLETTPPASIPAPAETRSPDSPGRPEQTLEAVENEVGDYQEKIAWVDSQLRSCIQSPSAEKVEAALTTLTAANHDFVEHQEEVHRQLDELAETHGDLRHTCADVRKAFDAQVRQIEHSNLMVEAFDYNGDVVAGCQQMIVEATKLAGESHQLRDTLAEAGVAVAPPSEAPSGETPTQHIDATTGLLNRRGLQSALDGHWRGEGRRSRPLAAAMLDLDQFGRVNEQVGPSPAERLLVAIAEMLKSDAPNNAFVGRYSGDSFVLLLPDTDARQGANLAEKIRQGLEDTTFSAPEGPLQITVSCGVAGCSAQDTPDLLFARAEATLREAKRYGRNRSFVHEGKYPTPVVPPNLATTSRTIKY